MSIPGGVWLPLYGGQDGARVADGRPRRLDASERAEVPLGAVALPPHAWIIAAPARAPARPAAGFCHVGRPRVRGRGTSPHPPSAATRLRKAATPAARQIAKRVARMARWSLADRRCRPGQKCSRIGPNGPGSRCGCAGDVNPRIARSRCRVGRREFSIAWFGPSCLRCSVRGTTFSLAGGLLAGVSVTTTRGSPGYSPTTRRRNVSAASRVRGSCTRMSRTIPGTSDGIVSWETMAPRASIGSPTHRWLSGKR